MKNRSIHLVTVLSLFGITFSLAVGATASERQQVREGKQTDGSKRKTLRDLARERDIDLGLLARHAEAIVVGRLLDEQSTFGGDDYISTTHSLDVQRVIKDTKLNGPLDSDNHILQQVIKRFHNGSLDQLKRNVHRQVSYPRLT